MDVISTSFSALTVGDKRRKIMRSGSFVPALSETIPVAKNTTTTPTTISATPSSVSLSSKQLLSSDSNNNNNNNYNNSKIEHTSSFLPPANLPNRVATLVMRLCRPDSAFGFSKVEACPIFGCLARPSLGLAEYAKRLDQLMNTTSETLIVATVLVQRLHAAAPELFSELSVHRILGTAMTIACKFCEDLAESTTFYADSLGTNAQDLILMEEHFLRHIQFRAFVSPAQYEQTGAQLAAIGRPRYHIARSASTSIASEDKMKSPRPSTSTPTPPVPSAASSSSPSTVAASSSSSPSSSTRTQPKQLKRKFQDQD